MGDKNPKHVILQKEVKSSAPYRKLLRNIKNPFEICTKIFRNTKLISFASFSPLCYYMTAGGI
jgi:hypothetical protein